MHLISTTRSFTPVHLGIGLTLIWMSHNLSQLPSSFCQIPISTSKIGSPKIKVNTTQLGHINKHLRHGGHKEAIRISLDITNGMSLIYLRRAGSRMSTLLVAAMTLMSVVELNPSNWLSSSSIVRCTSLSPAFSESNL